MVQVLQPKVSGDAAQDSWSFEVTNQTNNLDERVAALESRIATAKAAAVALPDSATTLQVLQIIRDL